jgi:hypothetical protein
MTGKPKPEKRFYKATVRGLSKGQKFSSKKNSLTAFKGKDE